MEKPTIGFIGVGRMGANMARRLHDLGYRVMVVADARPASAAELAAELGATVPATLAGVTAGAEVIFTVVTDDAAMRAIFAPSGDSLLTGSAGKVFINCATLSPAVHLDVTAACRAGGADALEACMASSIPQARNGTLYLMTGGDEAVFRRVEPILRGLAGDLCHVGATGQAAKVKAIVNMVMNMNTAALAEGLGLGQALGLDLEMLRDVLSKTGANSRVIVTDGPDMIAREHDCFFSADHAAKDSGIANALAAEAGVAVPLSRATEAQYRRLIALGLGGLDKSAVAELTFPGRAGHHS